MANLDNIMDYLADGVKSVRFTPTWSPTPSSVYGSAYYSPLTGTVRMCYLLYYATAQRLVGSVIATIPEEYRPAVTYDSFAILQNDIGANSTTTRTERIYLESNGSLYMANFIGAAGSVKVVCLIMEYPVA